MYTIKGWIQMINNVYRFIFTLLLFHLPLKEEWKIAGVSQLLWRYRDFPFTEKCLCCKNNSEKGTNKDDLKLEAVPLTT